MVKENRTGIKLQFRQQSRVVVAEVQEQTLHFDSLLSSIMLHPCWLPEGIQIQMPRKIDRHPKAVHRYLHRHWSRPDGLLVDTSFPTGLFLDRHQSQGVYGPQQLPPQRLRLPRRRLEKLGPRDVETMAKRIVVHDPLVSVRRVCWWYAWRCLHSLPFLRPDDLQLSPAERRRMPVSLRFWTRASRMVHPSGCTCSAGVVWERKIGSTKCSAKNRHNSSTPPADLLSGFCVV